MSEPTKIYMSWIDMHRACRRIANQIDKKIDIIVALTRGGLAPGVCLSNILGTDKGIPVYTLGVSSYIDGKQGKLEVYQTFPINVAFEKNVLIVDDLVDTGDTLEAAIKHVNGMFPKAVFTAVLYQKDGCPIFPTYSALRAKKEIWIVLPWEVKESEQNNFIK